MAQTGYTPIQLYYSTTAATAPLVANLANGELAINITDGKLYYKDNAAALQVIGWKTVPTTAGGTGLTSYSQGDLLYYNSGTTLTALAKSTTATRYLSNTGTSNNPAWAQIDLTNGVTGTLPVGNGGTGLTTLATGRVPYGNATSAFSSLAGFNFSGTVLTAPVLAASSASASATITSTTTANARYLLLNNSADSNNVYVYCAGYGGGFVQADANAASFLYFSTQNIERMRVFGNGGVSINNTTDPGAGNLSVSGSVLVTSAVGLGYGTGSGGTVTQGVSRTTGVTLSKPTGAITMFSAAGSVVAATFTVTNTLVAATDTIILNQKSGTNLYVLLVTAVAAGSFNITFYTTGGVATDAPVINFSIIKGVTA